MTYADSVSSLIASKRISKSQVAEKLTAFLRSTIAGMALSLLCVNVYSEDWVPVYEEPRHRLVFENEHVLILNVNLPPGYVSLYHKHVIDLLYVTIEGTKVWAEPLNGKKREANVKTGDLRFSSDNHGMPHIHRVGNIGTTKFDLIGIGIKDQISGNAIPLEGDTSGMDMTMQKPHASVYRIRLEPGEKTGVHQHNLPYTKVYMVAGKLVNDSGTTSPVEAGEFQWSEGGESHSYENAGDEPIEIIEMQWR